MHGDSTWEDEEENKNLKKPSRATGMTTSLVGWHKDHKQGLRIQMG